MNRTYNTIYINKFLPPPGFEPGSLGTISRWLIHYAMVPHNAGTVFPDQGAGEPVPYYKKCLGIGKI